MMMHNIVVVHPGALGDVLLGLTAIRRIKSSYPTRHLLLVCRSDVGELLRTCGEIDETISIDSQFLTDLYCPHEEWSVVTRNVLLSCERLVCWLNDGDGNLLKNLQDFGVAEIIIQSPYDSSLYEQSMEDRYLESLLCWNLGSVLVKEKLQILYNADERQRTLENPINPIGNGFSTIAIHPGSGSLHKCVHPSLLATVAKRLMLHTDTRLLILSGPADEVSVNIFCDLLPEGSYEVIEGKPLTSIVHLLLTCDLFIGHDSGLTHLAASCGIPSVVLFGPTDPSRWAPRGRYVSVIQGKSCECADWSMIRTCQYRPCLDISAHLIIEESIRLLSQSASVEDASIVSGR